MYTEENEFDYNEYLNEVDDYNQDKKSPKKGLIVKVLLIVLCLVLVIFLVFKIKNNNSSNNKDNGVDNSSLVFNNNLKLLKEAAEIYFFENNNMPKEVEEEVVVVLRDLKEQKLIGEIKDSDGYLCGYNTSYISMLKNQNNYMLKIYLLCSSIEKSVIYYYDLEYNCLNQNGEEYIPSDTEEDNSQEEDNNQEQETIVVCDDFGDWTTVYIDDPTLERESRVLVIGYKDNITYGNWSEPTTTPITESEVLEVKIEEKEESVTNVSDWIIGLTSKPSEKEGRKIESYTKKKAYTTYKTSTKTYTKELSVRDSKADSCKSTGIGKVTCTYTETVKTPVTNYKTVTYYKYQDTTTTIVKNTYYSSREIIKGEPIYTDYILESEIPVGYQKLAGSEIIEYRYREVCTK